MYIGENKIPENSKRNGFIDFLKFIFAIIILIHHSWQFFPILPIGYIGVEFFFLVTGWLMAKKFMILSLMKIYLLSLEII
jgi:hypothetical protein